jgi:hypothetical protein
VHSVSKSATLLLRTRHDEHTVVFRHSDDGHTSEGGGFVDLIELAEMELTYTALEALDYGSGGQLYGTMEGTVTGDRLNGALHLTNLAQRRPDNVNLPTLRGLLTTADGSQVWVELDGIATLGEEDEARVFVTGCRFRTGSDQYGWLNTTVGVLEGILDSVGVGGRARGRLYGCRATVT